MKTAKEILKQHFDSCACEELIEKTGHADNHCFWCNHSKQVEAAMKEYADQFKEAGREEIDPDLGWLNER